jgi:hypothetical protein
MERNTDDSDDSEGSRQTEEVGYKRPPAKNRFKKGRSGNGRGRPRGRQNVAKVASRLFDETIPIRIGDTKLRLPYMEALVQVTKVKAMQGDAKAQRNLTYMMEQLGLYDEKSEPERQGVLVVSKGRPTQEEWYYMANRPEGGYPDLAK